MEKNKHYNVVINKFNVFFKDIVFITVLVSWAFLSANIVFAANVTVSDSNITLVLPSDTSTYSLASSNTFDNLVVNNANFVFTLPSGASIFITSLLSNRALANTLDVSTTCGSGESTLSITNSSGSQEVVTITPGSACVTTTNTSTPTPTTITRIYGQSQSRSVTPTSQTSTSVTTTVTSTSVSSIPRDLTLNSTGSDVKMLQEFLNSQGFVIAKTGAGSVGNETTFFGSLTKAALVRFQKYYHITPPVGYFGPITRAVIKNL